MSILPNLDRLPAPVRPAATHYIKCRDKVTALEAELGRLDNLTAQAEAEARDTADMLAALENDMDPVDTGTPNESNRRARVAALTKAVAAMRVETVEAEAALGGIFLEHRPAILKHADKGLPAAATAYTAAIDRMLAERLQYELALTMREWAYAISVSDPVPNFGVGEQSHLLADDFAPPVDAAALHARLLKDARRHERLAVAEAAREARAEQDARAQAINDQMGKDYYKAVAEGDERNRLDRERQAA